MEIQVLTNQKSTKDKSYKSFGLIEIANQSGGLVSEVKRMLNVDKINIIDVDNRKINQIDLKLSNANELLKEHKGFYMYYTYDHYHKSIDLFKISEDSNELISNIDSNSNYIIEDGIKYYSCGKFKNRFMRDSEIIYVYYDYNTNNIITKNYLIMPQ